MKLLDYLALLDDSEQRLADAFTLLATRHSADAEVQHVARRLATWSVEKRAALRPALARYGRARTSDCDRLYDPLFRPRLGGYGLVRDLHDANVFAHHVYLTWTCVHQAAQALIDEPLVELCKRELECTERQTRWLRTMVKVTSAQALTVVPEKTSELRATMQAMKPRLAAIGAAVAAIGVVGAAAVLVRRAKR